VIPPAVAWFEARAEGAPGALRDRAARYLEAVAGTAAVPEALATAGLAALRHTIDSPGDRSVALDLLAADALVTLALEAQAESDPSGLAGFARRLRNVGAVGS
jgi:regulator of protease activity HflC (stomatin/prohibitin superfamily)